MRIRQLILVTAAVALLIVPTLILARSAPAPAPLAAPPQPGAHATMAADRSTGAASVDRGGPIPTIHVGPGTGATPSRWPHPGPVQAVGPRPAFAGHYYAGSVYNATPFNSTHLSAKIHVPLDRPQSTDFYYVLLSVWDDASSYDQVGFANANGVWGFTYSSTDYCASNYFFSPDAFELTPGVTYNFSMFLSGGSVTFNGTDPSGVVVFTYQQFTGGSSFVNQGFYDCNGTSYYDLTDYEEVYQTNNSAPPYVFYFTSNVADAHPFSGWGPWDTPPLPAAISVLVQGPDTTIANTPFDLQIVSTPSSVLMVVNASPRSFNFTVRAVSLVPNGSIPLWIYSLPGAWSGSVSRASGTPPVTSVVNFTVPGSSSVGNFTVGIAAGDPAGAM
ncbi:MAG TPA: hypothetical protein VIZ68_03425, partial [Thermoplasmata archaeon]